ncbi:hypothetical protein [Rhodococcus sp. KBS0724]|uniref:hypothetical protein n=1 Tax=Rhodococcus sp. KBS0724 TaxID=1179674 RepID=UPI0037C8605A
MHHYLASLLIASGADIKTVQARMRHASAKTTLDVYGHLWPDADESTRLAIDAVITKRVDSAIGTADGGLDLRTTVQVSYSTGVTRRSRARITTWAFVCVGNVG